MVIYIKFSYTYWVNFALEKPKKILFVIQNITLSETYFCQRFHYTKNDFYIPLYTLCKLKHIK